MTNSESTTTCIHELFERQVELTPARLALSYEGSHYTYRQLNGLSNRLAHELISRGVEPGDYVGLCFERSAEMIAALLAILKAGAAYVPLDPRNPRDRLEYILKDARLFLVMGNREVAEKIASDHTEVIPVEADNWQVQSETSSNPGLLIDPANIAYIIYTSGSTGKPKGVKVRHDNIGRLFTATQHWYEFDETDVWTMFHSVSFDFSVWEIWGALIHGGRLVIVPHWVSRSPESFHDLVMRESVTVLNQTPSAFMQFIKADVERNEPNLSSLRHVIFGGEALNIPGLKPWFDLHGDSRPRLVNMYGITETTVHVTYRPLSRADIDKGTGSVIGVPISDLQLYLLDDALQPVPDGTVGEIHVGGAGVAEGYLHLDDLTKERFVDNPFSESGVLYKSGDLARRHPTSGELEYIGRNDAQVKIRGFRIELGEIESVLSSHPSVHDVVVAAHGNGEDLQLVAYLVSAEPMDTPVLRLHASERLPDYMVPTVFMQLDEIPLTDNGKKDRRGLPDPDATFSLSAEFRAPETETEFSVSSIWRALFDVWPIGRHDDFFALGGHSLKAIQLLSRVRSQFGVEIEMRQLFENSSVAEFSEILDRQANSARAVEAIAIATLPCEVPLRLSYAQERLWFIDQLESSSAMYNIAFSLRLSDSVDVVSLEWALQQIVERHAVLRSRIELDNSGNPLQQVTSTRLSLSHRIMANRDATALESLVVEEGSEPFDLSDDLKIRATLIQLGNTLDESGFLLLVTIHHIAADGWSVDLFTRELGELYAARLEGRSPNLATLSVQYADFASWQRHWLDAGRLEQQLSYWTEQLDGAPSLLELPSDRPRSAIQSFEGRTHSFVVRADLTEKLRKLSARRGATLYMTLLASFKVLLSRYSGQQDIVVGSPIANRTQEEIEPLIGFFVNTLVLRSQVSSDASFEELLEQVRDTTLSAYQHQEVPFEKLVEMLQPERSLSHSPLFQVMFAMQSRAAPGLPQADQVFDWQECDLHSAMFDLVLDITEAGDVLTAGINYNTSLFDRVTIERMSGHLQVLLESIVDDPQTAVSRLPLMSESERRLLLEEWNDTARVYPAGRCLHHLIEEQVKRTPEACAVVFENEQLSYRELNVRANQLAHHLLELGVVAGDCVGLCLERSLEMVVSVFAVLKAGGAFVPLDPEFPEERLGYILEDAVPPVVLVQRHLVAVLPESTATLVSVDDDWALWSHQRIDDPDAVLDVDDPAYVIFTSGSTGRPKGAMNSHRGICNRLLCMQEDWPLDASDRVLQKTPLSFDPSVWELFCPLSNGARLIVAPPAAHRDPNYLVSAVQRHGISVLDFVPSMLLLFLETQRVEQCRSLKRVYCGGEALSSELQERFFATFDEVDLHNLYGPSEAAIDVLNWTCQKGSTESVVPIGYPVANTQVYVLDVHMQPVPVGVPGELHIGGTSVGLGYVNRPDQTRERFIADPFNADRDARLYKTGDLARYRADGAVEYLGRIDTQVKLRGVRIELGEVESAMLSHAQVTEAVVVLSGDDADRQLVGYHVSTGQLGVERLRAHLSLELPGYMVPSILMQLEAIPLMRNGKVDREALPKPDAGLSVRTQYAAPQGDTERTLSEIWSELLGVDRVGRNDDFFALGGHSLKAIQVISRIRLQFGTEFSVRQLFECPTIAAFSARIDGHAYPNGFERGGGLERVPRDGELTLSYAQERLWFLDQLEGSSALYNMPMALRLTGELNTAALERALEGIVERHEVLRTALVTNELGEPVQRISEAHLQVSRERVSGNRDQCERALERLIEDEAARVFDLSESLKIRATLVRLEVEGRTAEAEHVLLVTMHHVASDGWSFAVFTRELAAYYGAACQDEDLTTVLPALAVQYADFAAWQRAWLDEARLSEQLAYWKGLLAGAPALLELPNDRLRPAEQSFAGDTETFELSAELTGRLKGLSASHGATLYMTLLSAFSVLLARYSGEEDIVVGSPIANRTHEEVEPLIGFFLNTLVLRMEVSGDLSFAELLGQVRETALSAYQHQDVPFEKLLEELQPARSLSYSPLFQVLFQLQNHAQDESFLSGIEVENLEAAEQSAKFDLTLGFHESGDRLSGWMNYSTALFDRSTIRRMVRHLEVLLEGIVASPEDSILTLPLIDAAESKQLLITWNETARDYPLHKCLHEFVEDQVKRTPDAVAVESEDRRLSFDDLNRRANRLAGYLIAEGVGAGVCVGLCMERSLEAVVGACAVLKAGGAFVPLDPDYPPERLASMLQDAEIPVVLVQSALQAVLPAHDAKVLCVDTEWSLVADHSPENPGVSTSPDDPAYVIFTSGSTGRPKGAMNSHRGICNRLLCMQERWTLDASDRILQKTPFNFDPSIWELFCPLMSGARLILARPEGHKDPEYLVATVQHHGITALEFVPSMLQQFLETDGVERCTSVKRVYSGGEALSVELQKRFFEVLRSTTLYNTYGPSEAAIDVVNWTCERGSDSPTIPIGYPIANTQLYILDAGQQPVPIGVQGELYIGGVPVGMGYVNRPEQTRERFIRDPFVDREGARLYRTGDLARYRADGAVLFLGRLDTQVKLRGMRIELAEIESVALTHPRVVDAVVTMVGEADAARLVGHYVSADELGNEELRSHLSRNLPAYMVPAFLIKHDAMPLLPSGKIDRRTLAELDPGQLEREQYMPPQHETEVALAGIWSELLAVDRVGRGDDFFALGGHSLKAIQMVSRLRSHFAIELPLRALFSSPTVAGLSALIDDLRSADTKWIETDSVPLVALARKGEVALSYSQERLWFLDELEGSSALYNIPLALRLRGEPNAQALEAALQGIVARHEVLRTALVSNEAGEPVQRIGDASLALGHERVSGSREACEAVLRTLMEAEAEQVFDLSEALKIRATLVRLEIAEEATNEEHVLLVTMHHVASDGWSVSVFTRELAAYYGAACRGEELATLLPALPVQYADFAAWQRAWLDEVRLGEQLAYWKAQLSGSPSLLELPTDRVRPAVQSFAGDTETFELSAELTGRLKALSASHGATLYMTLLSAFSVLLARYSGEEDIVVGSPIANRMREEVEPLIGFFLNTLVLRTEVSGDLSFAELLGQVRETALSAYQHQDVPFEKLVEELQPARSLSYSPLFQVLFQLQNNPGAELSLAGVMAEYLWGKERSAKFDLTLGFHESGDRLSGWMNYSTALFDGSTIRRMVGHLEVLLKGIVASPEVPVLTLPLLAEQERATLTQARNATTMDYPRERALASLVAGQVAERLESTAVVGADGAQLSYAALESASNRLARYLEGAGIGAGDRVGIYLDRGVAMVVSLLGVMKSGAAYVPLDPLFPADRLAYMVADAGVRHVLTSASLVESVPGGAEGAIDLDALAGELERLSAEPIDHSRAESTAYVIYTSGSTGEPKGVAVSHRALVNFLYSMRERPGLKASDRLLAVTTLSFDIAGLELYLPLLVGARVELASREEAMDPVRLSARLASSGATVMQGTPATWRLLLEGGWSGGPELKMLCGGEALPRELADRLLDTGGELWNLYGPTETTIWSTVGRVVAGDGPITVGGPIGNTEVYVLDGARQVVPVGVSGELYIGGEGVAEGYLGRSELTDERFVPDRFSDRAGSRLYRTGDRARWRADGELEVLGRLDDQVKLRGYRIEPGEIRARILEQPGVADAVVVVREDRPGDQQLVSYLVADVADAAIDTAALRQSLKETLPEYMVPPVYVELAALPLTPNGKVDKRSLPVPQRHSQEQAPKSAPRGPLEWAMAPIWSELLNVAEIGRDDDFFELGGHSLLAVNLVSRMQRDLGIRAPLVALFQSGSIAELAAYVEAREPDAGLRPEVVRAAEALLDSDVDPLEGVPSAGASCSSNLSSPHAHDSTRPSSACRRITPGGLRAPLFMLGSNPRYRIATRHFHAEQPAWQLDIYALQAARAQAKRKPLKGIEEISEAFIDDIKRVQPAGPYYLGGGCEGALVAFETARQLQKRGEAIGRLIVWGLPGPGRYLKQEFSGSSLKRLWWQLDSMLRKGSLGENSLRAYREILRHERIEHSIFDSMLRYVPRERVDSDLLLLMFDHYLLDDPEAGNALGWDAHVTGEVQLQRLDGDHDTWLTAHAESFGRLLAKEMDRLRE